MTQTIEQIRNVAVPVVDDEWLNAWIESEIHQCGGVFIKTSKLPSRSFVGKHTHTHDHISILVSGEGVLYVNGKSQSVCGFKIMEIKAGDLHEFHATAPSIWLCVWSVDAALNSADAAQAWINSTIKG